MMFLLALLAGVLGLIFMALPGMQQHGHAGGAASIHPPALHPSGHAGGHTGISAAAHSSQGSLAGQASAGHSALSPAHPSASSASAKSAAEPPVDASGSFSLLRLLPSPRALFSMLALWGAFGYALLEMAHISLLIAGLCALIPAWGIEAFAVRPLWNTLFRFQGNPSTPLETLALSEAKAVTEFRNGKGMISVQHDGRVVQLMASLSESQAAFPVRVGDTLRVEEIDSEKQRAKVTLG